MLCCRGCALVDDGALACKGARELRALLLNRAAPLLDAAEHPVVVRTDAVGRVEPLEQVAHAAGAEEDLHGRLAAAGRVQRHGSLGERPLRAAEAALREPQHPGVAAPVVRDLVELDVREVVRLSRPGDLHVDRADLLEHARGLGLLARDVRGVGSGPGYGSE